jgi:hypothetical protein
MRERPMRKARNAAPPTISSRTRRVREARTSRKASRPRNRKLANEWPEGKLNELGSWMSAVSMGGRGLRITSLMRRFRVMPRLIETVTRTADARFPDSSKKRTTKALDARMTVGPPRRVMAHRTRVREGARKAASSAST